MNECLLCKRKFVYQRSKGGTKTKCNTCQVNERRFKLRQKIIDYLGGKCCLCGYSKCYGALHAHHIDFNVKKFNISGAHSRSWNEIKQELSQCILICSNCHSELHHNCISYNCQPGVSPLSYTQSKG